MSKPKLMCHIVGIDSAKFSRVENLILEAKLLTRVYSELRELFRDRWKDYFRLMKFTFEMENNMLDTHFARTILDDIITSGQYSLQGVAYYTQTFEEVLIDIMSGVNLDPSFPLVRKIIDLHTTVRPILYYEIMKKVIQNELSKVS